MNRGWSNVDPVAGPRTNDAGRGIPALPLQGDEVHVWWARLDEAAREEPPEARAALSRDELERAAQFYFASDSRRYVAGRTILRRLLGRYLGRNPASLAFAYGRHGKPRLVSAPHRAAIFFNVTHADGLALFAITRSDEVGIDVERVREIPEWERISAACFDPREHVRLRRVPSAHRREAFFRAWTRQEAVLKALGLGLGGPLPPAGRGALDEFSVRTFLPAPGYVAALAVARGGCRTSCVAWPRGDPLTAGRIAQSGWPARDGNGRGTGGEIS